MKRYNLSRLYCLIILLSTLFLYQAQGQVSVRADGVVQVNGNSFFPYGFYTDEKSDKQAMFNHVSTTGKAGFNVIHIESLENDSLRAIFTEAAANNQYVIYGAYKAIKLPALHKVYDKIKNQPALLAHNIGDDVQDGTMVGYPANVSDVKELYDDLRIYDPMHISMVALGGSGGQIDVFSAKRFDTAAEEIYPVNGGSEINLVYKSSLGIVANSLKWKQSPWVALQTFNWNQNPSQRMPTFNEYYNMLYQSIVAGVKGVMLYTYHVGSKGVDTDLNLFNGIKTTVPEINKIKQFITEGTFTKTELGIGLYAATWEYQNQVLAIVVHAGKYRSYFDPSTNAADTRNVSLPLPSGTYDIAKPAFVNRPTGMVVVEGKLEGNINLLDVHAYIINKIEVLKVNASSLTGKAESGGNKLGWTTFSEENNSHFEIERSSDGTYFEKIGALDGHGTSDTKNLYSYLDKISTLEPTYYRLKQVDIDGKFQYSITVILKSNFEGKISVYPNPFQDEININLNIPQKTKIEVLLYDVFGRKQNVKIVQSGNGIKCKTHNLQTGSYFLKIVSGANIYNQVLIKN